MAQDRLDHSRVNVSGTPKQFVKSRKAQMGWGLEASGSKVGVPVPAPRLEGMGSGPLTGPGQSREKDGRGQGD
jgi:hypothetical protein